MAQVAAGSYDLHCRRRLDDVLDATSDQDARSPTAAGPFTA
jgi:hypothetical protein